RCVVSSPGLSRDTRRVGALMLIAELRRRPTLEFREWDGPAALPPPTVLRVRRGLVRKGSPPCPARPLFTQTAIGIDMGKNTLHLIGLDARGAIMLREKVARGRIALRLANLPPCLIGIEAGMATHYVA